VGEVVLGYGVERDVGALIMVAAGGVLTEIARDRSLRLAPIDLATAHEMIAEVRTLIALAGYRGRPAGDLDALAHAIVALSRLADDASIAEAEINPLILRPAGEGRLARDPLGEPSGNAQASSPPGRRVPERQPHGPRRSPADAPSRRRSDRGHRRVRHRAPSCRPAP